MSPGPGGGPDDPTPEPRRGGDGPSVPELVEVLRAVDDEPPGGPFPSWGWLYATVVAWAAFLVLLLYLFTVTLDFGAR